MQKSVGKFTATIIAVSSAVRLFLKKAQFFSMLINFGIFKEK